MPQPNTINVFDVDYETLADSTDKPKKLSVDDVEYEVLGIERSPERAAKTPGTLLDPYPTPAPAPAPTSAPTSAPPPAPTVAMVPAPVIPASQVTVEPANRWSNRSGGFLARLDTDVPVPVWSVALGVITLFGLGFALGRRTR